MARRISKKARAADMKNLMKGRKRVGKHKASKGRY